MIAYNKTWLANLRLQKQLEKDKQKGCISEAELNAIKEKYAAGFYSPGIPARVGMFILTCIIMLFACGLITLIASSSSFITNPGFPIFLGLFSYVMLEFMVSASLHYRSGVDDALLYISWGLLAGGFAMMFTDHAGETSFLLLSEIICAISIYFCLRFTDTLMATISCIAFFSVVFFGWRYVPGSLVTMPFIMMLVSAGLYWLVYRFIQKPQAVSYEYCLVVVQVIALVALYAAGNYYVVQSLGDELNGTVGKAVPFGYVFWAWTILLPLVYAGFGIRRKDAVLLRTGLILIAAAAITFRNYYHVLPIDTTLTIIGAVILGIAYSTMKYLETLKHGFTYAKTDNADLMDELKAESLIIAETFSATPAAPADNGVKFGGGDFGGGGSSSSF